MRRHTYPLHIWSTHGICRPVYDDNVNVNDDAAFACISQENRYSFLFAIFYAIAKLILSVSVCRRLQRQRCRSNDDFSQKNLNLFIEHTEKKKKEEEVKMQRRGHPMAKL